MLVEPGVGVGEAGGGGGGAVTPQWLRTHPGSSTNTNTPGHFMQLKLET